MKANITPSKNILDLLLSYSPNTGILKWKNRDISFFKNIRAQRIWNTRYANKEAFSYTRKNGNKTGCIFGHKFLAHRIIWKIVTGEEADVVDHINGTASDNRITNLRSVSQEVNRQNAAKMSNNTSVCVGVSFASNMKKWRARINKGKKHYQLGFFRTKEEAIEARKNAEKSLGFSDTHGRNRTY